MIQSARRLLLQVKKFITLITILIYDGIDKNNTVYAVIFKGCKFRRFHCKLIEREILILEKKQWLKETMYST